MYYFFLLGKIIALSLPRGVVYLFARFFALTNFYFSRKDREAVIYNLRPLVEDCKKRKKAAKDVFINFAYYLVDFFRYSKLNTKFIKRYVKFEGLEIIDQKMKEKKGIILVTAHLGNYELGGAVLSLLGYPLSVVALPHLDLRTNNFFNKQRRRVGIKVIPTGLSVKESIEVLNQGKILALLGDRDFSHSGRKSRMFSRYAHIPRGLAFFAKKSKAALVPAFFIRENKYCYRLCFEKEIEARQDSRSDGFEEEVIKKYVSVLEKYLKKYPQQWYLFQKYWR